MDSLLDRFTRGDPAAFESLFRRHQREVLGWVHRIVRDPDEAEDLTVEAFMKMYRARARFDPSREFGPWARRIATNLALSRLRSLARRRPLPAEARMAATPGSEQRWLLRTEIAHAFGELTPKLRLVATLALVEQVPYREIADALGVSPATVKSRVFRAVRRLREVLEARGVRP